jgi:hypothetical protein
MSGSAVPRILIKHDEMFDHSRTPEFQAWVIKKLRGDISKMQALLAESKARILDEHILIATEYLARKPVSMDVLTKMCRVIGLICAALLHDGELTPEQIRMAIKQVV